MHVEDGDLDLAGELALERATAEYREGATGAADRILTDALARLEGAAEGTTALVADTLRVRIAAPAGRLSEAQARLERLGQANSTSPSLTRRLAYLAARGAVAASVGKLDAMRTDYRQAVALAESAGRVVEALELRLDLAAIEARANSSQATILAQTVETEATRLGLRWIAGRARQIRTVR